MSHSAARHHAAAAAAQSLLTLRWREWLTKRYVGRYLSERSFYKIQLSGDVDNPDQRINADIAAFTGTALGAPPSRAHAMRRRRGDRTDLRRPSPRGAGFALTLFSSVLDLASFSGILFSIYPPLFGVLIGAGHRAGATAATAAPRDAAAAAAAMRPQRMRWAAPPSRWRSARSWSASTSCRRA